MEANRPPLDNSAPQSASGADSKEQHPVYYTYTNIEHHPAYNQVCQLYTEVRNRTQWTPYAIKRHISILMRLALSTVSAIILDNYNID